MKIAKILSDATIPNYMHCCELCNYKCSKVSHLIFVINVALPILVITLCSDLALFPCSLTSCWYLLIRKIQLVLENIKIQIKKERINVEQINNKKAKEILKKLGYNK